MQVITNYHHCPKEAQHSVVALGNFDGVHLGHKQIIQTTKDIAHKTQHPSAILTFEPHPVSVLRPDQKAFRIFDFEAKRNHVKALAIDYMFCIGFDEAFSRIKAEDFVNDILIQSFKVSHVIIGHDFIFGHKRGGNATMLQSFADEGAFTLHQIEAVGDDTVYSSSRIRNKLSEGDIQEVNRLLGHQYQITGMVINGEQRGRTIGFPTANVLLSSDLLHPAYGVYAVQVTLANDPDTILTGVANIGIRPSFSDSTPLLEVHLFDFSGTLYHQVINVSLLEFIRPEQKFDSVEALQSQIHADCKKAKTLCANL